MQINPNTYSIAEILAMLERRELHVNRDYQRGSGLWPDGPSSYFIDTVLENYPFPKIYFYEYLQRPDREMKKEIVDGQQRINTILRFYNNEFSLGTESRLSGHYFRDLDDDDKDKFLGYAVSVDVIRNARPSEILQMFRRMNAYTLPLNDAEKRHSGFQGKFKWFINDISGHLNEFIIEYGVFNKRQVVRMADAEFLSEVILSFERGIISTSPTDLKKLYEKYDIELPYQIENDYRSKIIDTTRYIFENFEDLRKTNMMKSYALHSLIVALVHCKYGIAAIEGEWGVHPTGRFAVNPENASRQLLALAQAHEAKEIDGPFGKYVWGASGGTNREPRRRARVAQIMRILGAEVPEAMDADLPQ